MKYLHALQPPYATLSSWQERSPLGSVLVTDFRFGIAALIDGIRHHRSSPWCPLCIVDPEDSSLSQLEVFAPYEGAFAIVRCPDLKQQVSPPLILDSIRQRISPTPEAMARYVVNRLDCGDAFKALVEAFDGRAQARESLPPRTLSRRIHNLGALHIRNWNSIGKLIRALCSNEAGRLNSIESIAFEHGVDPRSFRNWLRLCTDLHFRDAAGLAGWEWILESALRRWGYVRLIGRNCEPEVAQREIGSG